MDGVLRQRLDTFRAMPEVPDDAAGCSYLAFDTIGKNSYQPDHVRLRLLLELLHRGLGRHVLLSNDISRHAYLTGAGGQGYAHVLGPFAARLRESGVDSGTLDLLCRRNPLRWLTGHDPEEPT
jgi:phosphotriesterase-related protein